MNNNLTDILYRANTGSLYEKKQLDSSSVENDIGNDITPEDAEQLLITEETVNAIVEWVETNDLEDEFETLADRLYALFVGIFDANKNGELDADEEAVLDMILNIAWEYFSAKGVSDEDSDALLNKWDNDAANRVIDLLASTLPDGEDDMDADIERFVWGDDQEPMLDSASNKRLRKLGGTFRKVYAIRNGKKVRINKRIGGKARLTGKQRMAIRRMQSKRISAGSRLKRMRSMRLSRRMAL